MAEFAFHMVPSDPFYLPDDARATEFLEFARLEMLGDGEWGEHYDWWQSAMSLPPDSKVKSPCCGAETCVVDFRFDRRGAFARFSVGALEPSTSDYWEDEEPGRDNRLKPETLRQFEKILGCGVLQIWEVRS